MKHIGETTKDIELPNSKPTAEQRRSLKFLVDICELNRDEHELMFLSCAFEDAARRVREKSS